MLTSIVLLFLAVWAPLASACHDEGTSSLWGCDADMIDVSQDVDAFRRALNGSHLVFCGDSVTRYQYLTLAYTLLYGKLPATTKADYFVYGNSFESWETFYTSSSDTLSVQTPAVNTEEVCFCSKPENERRFFLYEGADGIRFKLSYVLYFKDGHCTDLFCPNLEMTLRTIAAARPTHVALNFGIHPNPHHSGDSAYHRERYLCDRFHQPLNYTLLWLDTTPSQAYMQSLMAAGRVEPPADAALGFPQQCSLAPTQYVERKRAVHELFWSMNTTASMFLDPQHVRAFVYHQFNVALLNTMAMRDAAPLPA